MIPIEYYNPHWEEGFSYGFGKKRRIFDRLYKNLKNKFIIILTGQRRTGKTTLMKQLIDKLIHCGVKRRNIFFYSFDEEKGKIFDVLKSYENYLGEDINREKRFLFLDEIQKVKGWETEVKFFYDNYRNLKFFLTGSASLFIRRGMLESLAGRTIDFVLPPLNFSEYLYFKNKEHYLGQPKLHYEKLLQEFSMFLKRPYIEIIEFPEDEIRVYMKNLVEKIIYVDIPSIFPVEEVSLIERLFKIIAERPGLLLNYNELSKELGYHRVTISNYLEYLESGFLVIKIYNFSKSLITSEKKLKKFYPYTPAFCSYIVKDVPLALLVENLIISALNVKYFWRDSSSREVDAVLLNEEAIPVEIKFKNKISDKDLSGLRYFLKKFKSKRGILITQSLKSSMDNIELIPAWEYENLQKSNTYQ